MDLKPVNGVGAEGLKLFICGAVGGGGGVGTEGALLKELNLFIPPGGGGGGGSADVLLLKFLPGVAVGTAGGGGNGDLGGVATGELRC